MSRIALIANDYFGLMLRKDIVSRGNETVSEFIKNLK
jgi:hypothetical protein